MQEDDASLPLDMRRQGSIASITPSLRVVRQQDDGGESEEEHAGWSHASTLG